MGRISGWRVVCSAVTGAVISPLLANAAQAGGLSDALKRAGDLVAQVKNPPSTNQAAVSQTPTSREAKQAAAPSTASGSASSNASAFDIVGLKLGMSIADARAAVKARKLPKYAEATGKLTFMKDGSVFADVPGGGFSSIISSYTTYRDKGGNVLPDYDHLYLDFTPEPGKERVVRISRTVGFSPSNYILESVLLNGLKAKYGPPSALASPQTNNTIVWMKGHDRDVHNCADGISEWISEEHAAPGNFVLADEPQTVLHDSAAKCGDYFLSVTIQVANPNEPAERHVVVLYSIELVSHALRWSALQSAMAMVESARQADSQQQTAKAKNQKKPEL